MIPNPHWNYPECFAEYSLEAKNKKAEEIYNSLIAPSPSYFKHSFAEIIGRCEHDFKLASLVAYKAAVDSFKEYVPKCPFANELKDVEKSILPVYYCGGDMCFGRVFSINHCAFSSPDSIIGFRNS